MYPYMMILKLNLNNLLFLDKLPTESEFIKIMGDLYTFEDKFYLQKWLSPIWS